MLAIAIALMSGGDPAGSAPRLPWISAADYPAALAQTRPEGITEVRLTFNPAGRVTGCAVTRSSGAALLDATTCRLGQRRARAKAGEPRVQIVRHRWAAPRAR